MESKRCAVRTKPLAGAADATRDTIWQGNCDVGEQPSRSNISQLRITIAIENPLGNCPAKFRVQGGFILTAQSGVARRSASTRSRGLLAPGYSRLSPIVSGDHPHLIIRVSRSLDPEKANFLFARLSAGIRGCGQRAVECCRRWSTTSTLAKARLFSDRPFSDAPCQTRGRLNSINSMYG